MDAFTIRMDKCQSSVIGVENDEINVSGLPSGLYILKLNVGDDIVVKRFAKKQHLNT